MKSSYKSWVLTPEHLVKPLVERMQQGAAFLPVEGMASHRGMGADDEEYFTTLQAVAGRASSDIIKHSGATRSHMLVEASGYPILQTDGAEGSLVCLSYCGKKPSNDWKMVSLDASSVVLEKENEPVWEISFE